MKNQSFRVIGNSNRRAADATGGILVILKIYYITSDLPFQAEWPENNAGKVACGKSPPVVADVICATIFDCRQIP
jgi:hypothetical protein